ncbi:TetR family transcriptional regulator C-terminal domain-containing protein [Streptomyces avermitilis]|uniref:TetR family transcriptional regulator C-terminal domain-containing protein n=1 Tax=Streptomyces avermitilis TaxID=33903 RepID=UPI00367BDCA9
MLDALSRWTAYVTGELSTAVEAGRLPSLTDVDQLAFELNGVMLAADQAIQLHHDPQAPDRARRAIGRLLKRRAARDFRLRNSANLYT